MNTSATVAVYGYVPRRPEAEKLHSWRHKAPREVIEERLQAEVIEGTAEEVPVSELDAEGRFCRRATGWGELGD